MRAVAVGLTDVGLQREHNEDSFVVLDPFDLFVVADGMGGHSAGDVASRLATDTISDFFRSTANEDMTWPFHFDTSLSEEENRLITGIRVANRQIFERSTRSRDLHGMGTTVVGAMFSASKGRMYVGHVGDSRCYRLRDGKIKLLTRDHSLFNDYILAMPDLTEEQRRELPRNVITRALGIQDQVIVDLQHEETFIGDVFVLCSDGLSGMLEDDEIEAIVNAAVSSHDACRILIERANARGGEDNITAVVVRIQEETPSMKLETSKTEAPPAPTSAVSFARVLGLSGHDTGDYDEPTAPALSALSALNALNAHDGAAVTAPAAVSDALKKLAQLGEAPTDPHLDLKAETDALETED